jgi:hypothetical protein
VLAGVVEERGIESLFKGNYQLCAALSLLVRTANTFLGSLLWVDFIRLLGECGWRCGWGGVRVQWMCLRVASARCRVARGRAGAAAAWTVRPLAAVHTPPRAVCCVQACRSLAEQAGSGEGRQAGGQARQGRRPASRGAGVWTARAAGTTQQQVHPQQRRCLQRQPQ